LYVLECKRLTLLIYYRRLKINHSSPRELRVYS
jgi:hypothetical protein